MAIARLGGRKGYLTERKPGITTFWMGVQKFAAIMQGWLLFRNVSRRSSSEWFFYAQIFKL